MTLLVLAVLVAGALLAYGEYTYRRGIARIPTPTVEDPARSAYAGGFGPEWGAL